MDKEKFRAYFAKESQTKFERDGIQIARVLSSATENVTSANLAEDEIQNLKISNVFDVCLTQPPTFNKWPHKANLKFISCITSNKRPRRLLSFEIVRCGAY